MTAVSNSNNSKMMVVTTVTSALVLLMAMVLIQPTTSSTIVLGKRTSARRNLYQEDNHVYRRLAEELSDDDILNFALNLECLEAQFYSHAAFGVGLSKAERGGGPEPIGGQEANLTSSIQEYAAEIAMNEISHVTLLRSALGDYAVPCPLIDLNNSFALAAEAALGNSLDTPFNPYQNDSEFLLAAFLLEDVGVTAYLGTAPAIQDTTTLGVAAGILGVEAMHAGAVRSQLLERASEQLPQGIDVETMANAFSDLRAALGGGKETPLTDNQGDHLVAADDNAVAYSRSVDEVLSIVYFGDSDTPGGFFPQGVNIKSDSAAPSAAPSSAPTASPSPYPTTSSTSEFM